ncbi:probable Alanine/arginine aminopeptidase [Saccharomycodes ludwigii]|uniref:Aminopeptidase n=1 Tax=Saccharomycodes ludwigii TaxID=36035 RepID=A0A376B6H4_9ASCO|nr:probable Alanine/arginine aminopeptidase [Saccharomycodes ludwigii]
MSITNSHTKTPERDVLPNNVKPLNYNLTIEPNFETFKFDGNVKITLQVNDPNVNTVELNTAELKIHQASIISKDKKIKSSNIITNEEKQVTKFEFIDISAGISKEKTIILDIDFSGTLNDQMAGFYRAKYVNKETQEVKYMATTQMEPTDARRAFPCFDEPNLKATFEITLISTPNFTHLSNMDLKSETIIVDDSNKEKKVSVFNTTPKMSTYLIAFIVSELKYVENTDFRIPIRVYATPGNEKDGQFAADLTAKTLDFFEKAFGIKYPLPKMDNVAVHEFSAGAMENWGLVTYRVVDLLLDPKKVSLNTIQRVAEVVQHELAHQWFGNLVTMDWWEGLWLNEGFATWMSWYSCNEFQPEWKVWEQYVTDNLQSALTLDSLRSSHPIEVPVKRADEINQIFDAISYSKGSSLLRMISKWLGEDVFVKGVSQYLNKFKYSNAKTEDLWEALAAVSGKNVPEVMNIWTKKVGFPIVTVEEVEENGKLNELKITQHRYLRTADVKPEEDETIYPVFLSLKTGKDVVDSSLVLDERVQTFKIKNSGESDFFKLNADQSNIYVTCYSDKRYKKLGSQADKLSVEDRAGLIAELGTLSASGYTSTTNLLELVRNWNTESSFVVFNQILSTLNSLYNTWVFEPTAVRKGLHNFVLDIISKKYAELGWEVKESDDFATKNLKINLFSQACACHHQPSIEIALNKFKNYVSGVSGEIDPLYRSAIFSTVARNGKLQDYESLFQIYQNENLPTTLRLDALRSLGRFETPELIQRTLGYLLDGTILKQDIYYPMGGLRATPQGIESLWNWLQKNWDEINKQLPPGLSMLGSIVNLGTSGFTSLEKIGEIKEFFSQRSTKGFDQSLAQSLDSIKSKALWVSRDRKIVSDFLEKNNYM